jgi:glycosyltransferase involved in cell wall biosynthesis
MLTIQTLISTMYQKNHSLLDKMNIQTDAIVVNQCDYDEIERFEYKGHKILWISLKERGIGLSRNTALMRATADIVLFADDDVQYIDGYPKKIINEFEKIKKADFIVFKMIVRYSYNNITKKNLNTNNIKKLHFFNSLHFGTFSFACVRKVLKWKNICFHLSFGGGTSFSCGEDSIFIMDSLKKKLQVYFSPQEIGTVYHKYSTWFKGYNEKYFFDKGVLLKYIFGVLGYPLGVLILLKNYKTTKELGFTNAVKNFFKGMRKEL